MQPLKLSIPGKYWDSQITRGQLYLFVRDGSLVTLDFNRLVDELPTPDRLRYVVDCAFRRSDYLYSPSARALLRNSEFRAMLLRHFSDVDSMGMSAGRQLLIANKQDNPFPFPHADSAVHKSSIYIAARSGLYSGRCTKQVVGASASQRWDCPIFSLAAGNNALALSSGEAGLWEFSLGNRGFPKPNVEPIQRSSNDCDHCQWMYQSIYGSSYDGGFLVEFDRHAEHPIADSAYYSAEFPELDFEQPPHERRQLPSRVVRRVILERDIFGPLDYSFEPGYSFGLRNKIYLAHDDKVQIVEYNPRNNELSFRSTVNILAWKGRFVGGGVATFGVILEYDNALVILPSYGDSITLRGEPVSWRVFPDSLYYQNHLHVIYEDHLDIYSFYNDYLVEQDAKLFGRPR
jgi:hypothetical protein